MLSLELVEEDVGQGNAVPGSLEPAHQEQLLPWTEVVEKI